MLSSDERSHWDADYILKGVRKIVRVDIELSEIQHKDHMEILRAKAREAYRVSSIKEFVVEDTSLYIEGLNGLPGPYLNWMEDALTADEIFSIVSLYTGDLRAKAVSRLAYVKDGVIEFTCEGVCPGYIVLPVITSRRGIDHFFAPRRYEGRDNVAAELDDVSLSRMNLVARCLYGHRGIALRKLKEYLREG